MKRSIAADQLSCSQPDCMDRSFNSGNFNGIANDKLLFKQNEKAVYNVCNEPFGSKPKGDTRNSSTGNQRSNRNSEKG